MHAALMSGGKRKRKLTGVVRLKKELMNAEIYGQKLHVTREVTKRIGVEKD